MCHRVMPLNVRPPRRVNGKAYSFSHLWVPPALEICGVYKRRSTLLSIFDIKSSCLGAAFIENNDRATVTNLSAHLGVKGRFADDYFANPLPTLPHTLWRCLA